MHVVNSRRSAWASSSWCAPRSPTSRRRMSTDESEKAGRRPARPARRVRAPRHPHLPAPRRPHRRRPEPRRGHAQRQAAAPGPRRRGAPRGAGAQPPAGHRPRWSRSLAEAGPLEAVGAMHCGAPELLALIARGSAPPTRTLDVITGQLGAVVGTYSGPGGVGVALLRAGWATAPRRCSAEARGRGYSRTPMAPTSAPVGRSRSRRTRRWSSVAASGRPGGRLGEARHPHRPRPALPPAPPLRGHPRA